jgi:hypothetical protein
MIDLDGELLRAVRFRQTAAHRVSALPKPWVGYGLALVSFYGLERRCYEPDPHGAVMAFVAPVVEGGELIDLVAIDARTDHAGFRLDLAHGLGLDVVERARQRCCELRLVATATAWLVDPRDAVWLRDLAKLSPALDGVEVIACESIELAQRAAALLPPSQRDRVQVA